MVREVHVYCFSDIQLGSAHGGNMDLSHLAFLDHLENSGRNSYHESKSVSGNGTGHVLPAPTRNRPRANSQRERTVSGEHCGCVYLAPLCFIGDPGGGRGGHLRHCDLILPFSTLITDALCYHLSVFVETEVQS